MPKPSLCSSARVAKPVKLNITSVGVLAFMPRSWHMAARGLVSCPADNWHRGAEYRARSTPDEQAAQDAAHRDCVGRDVRLLEHPGHALDAARAAPRAPDEQVDQPRVLVGAVRLLVHV